MGCSFSWKTGKGSGCLCASERDLEGIKYRRRASGKSRGFTQCVEPEAQTVIEGGNEGLEAHSEQSVLEGEAAKVHRWMKHSEKRGYKWGLGCS